VSAGQIAALVAACAFALLVILLAIPVFKLGMTLDEATVALRKAHENSDPIFTGANTTLTHVNSQLEHLDGITTNARTVSGNVSALSSLFTATLGGPLVKTAALSYGISKALRARRTRGEDEGKHARRGKRRGGRKK
jgi:predicted cobalt transporter CbtA